MERWTTKKPEFSNRTLAIWWRKQFFSSTLYFDWAKSQFRNHANTMTTSESEHADENPFVSPSIVIRGTKCAGLTHHHDSKSEAEKKNRSSKSFLGYNCKTTNHPESWSNNQHWLKSWWHNHLAQKATTFVQRQHHLHWTKILLAAA